PSGRHAAALVGDPAGGAAGAGLLAAAPAVAPAPLARAGGRRLGHRGRPGGRPVGRRPAPRPRPTGRHAPRPTPPPKSCRVPWPDALVIRLPVSSGVLTSEESVERKREPGTSDRPGRRCGPAGLAAHDVRGQRSHRALLARTSRPLGTRATLSEGA